MSLICLAGSDFGLQSPRTHAFLSLHGARPPEAEVVHPLTFPSARRPSNLSPSNVSVLYQYTGQSSRGGVGAYPTPAIECSGLLCHSLMSAHRNLQQWNSSKHPDHAFKHPLALQNIQTIPLPCQDKRVSPGSDANKYRNEEVRLLFLWSFAFLSLH